MNNNNELAYREEIQQLAAWCNDNNLVLNTKKIASEDCQEALIVENQSDAHPAPPHKWLSVLPASSFWVSTSLRTSLGS